MNLQIDIGNSFLKWRLLCSGKVIARGREQTSAHVSLGDISQWEEIKAVSVACVASVEVRSRLLRVLEAKLPSVKPFFAFSQASFKGVLCAYKEPASLGVDRWLGILAGYQKYKEACCVVDCGSAITVDVIDSSGVHLGGYIIPGVRLMRDSLISGTDGVVFDAVELDKSCYGKTTSECVYGGVEFALNSLFQGLKSRMDREGVNRIIVTGGDGAYVASLFDYVEFDEDLVLEGLSISAGGECGVATC